jgi:putative addiction module antidote
VLIKSSAALDTSSRAVSLPLEDRQDTRLALDYNLSYNADMLKLKVRAVGGSLGIILPKEALAKMKVQENNEVFLTEAPGGGYRLTPYSPEFERQMGVVEEIAKRRRNVLRELAK